MVKTHLALQDLRKKYQTKGFEMTVFLGFFRLELFLTNRLLKTDISANQITALGFGLGAVGCILISTSNIFLLGIGFVFLIGWAFSDYLDGNLARAKEMVSDVGFFLDLVVAHVIGVFALLSIGFAVSNLSIDQGQALVSAVLPSYLVLNPLIISFVGGVAYFLKRFLKAYFLMIVEQDSGPNAAAKGGKPIFSERTFSNKVSYLVGGMFKFSRSYTIVLLVFLALSKLYIWIYVVSLVFVVDAIRESINIVRGLRVASAKRNSNIQSVSSG